MSSSTYAPTLDGKAERFGLSGLEPDFDPIYQVIVSARLHDGRPAGEAFPDATLVLSAYLESFQPATTPTLPDLLNPNQVANSLAGFLQGKAALVNAAGHTVYVGSLLAEIFQDSTEHLVVDLDPVGGDPSAPATRLQGSLTLFKGGKEAGSLRALSPLAHSALAVPRGRLPSWQSVVAGLSVSKPRMMGNAVMPAHRAPTAHSTPSPHASVQSIAGLIVLAVGLALLILAAFVTLRRRGHLPAQS
jgi:hypothetical protein